MLPSLAQRTCLHFIVLSFYAKNVHIRVMQVFEAAPQEVRGVQAKRASVEYFLVGGAAGALLHGTV